MTRCYVCNAEPQDGCQAIDGEVAECPRWAPSFCERCGFPLNDAGECRAEADSGR